MTTNLLSVIEQLVDALDHCMDAITERGLNGSPDQAEKWGLQLPLERAYAALAAGQQALEQTQVGKPSIELPTIHEVEYQRVRGEAQKLAVSLWTKHYRDDAPQWTVLSDTLGALSQISNMVAGMVRPQATEPAPSTDICQNCAGQGWEPSVYKGKVPCSFCQPAPSTAGEREVSLVEAFDNARKLVTPEILESFDALLQSTALPDHSEQHLDMVATPKIGCVQHDCAECQARAALPVGELTLEQITRIYDRYGGDMVNCTRAIERELAAARSQPTTEESSVVAGAQPVREPQK